MPSLITNYKLEELVSTNLGKRSSRVMDYGHPLSRRQPPPPELRPPLQSDPHLHPRVGAAREKKPAIFNSIIGPAAWNGKAVFPPPPLPSWNGKAAVFPPPPLTSPSSHLPLGKAGKGEERPEILNPLLKQGQPQPAQPPPTAHHRPKKDTESEEKLESINPPPKLGQQPQPQPQSPTSPHRVVKAAECENKPESFNPPPQDREQMQSQLKPPPPSPQPQATLPPQHHPERGVKSENPPDSFNLYSFQGLQPQPQQQYQQAPVAESKTKPESFYGMSTAIWDSKEVPPAPMTRSPDGNGNTEKSRQTNSNSSKVSNGSKNEPAGKASNTASQISQDRPSKEEASTQDNCCCCCSIA
ncbi:hypothetical protein Ancab_000837 [Ancistrocladus abbreviatus]